MCFDLFTIIAALSNCTKIDDLAPGVISISVIVKRLPLRQDYFDSTTFDNENPFITNKQRKNILQFAN